MVEGRPGKDIDLMVAGMEFGRLGGLLRSLPARTLGIRRIVPVGRTFAVYKVRAPWAEEDIDVALARSPRPGGPDRRKRDTRVTDADAREDAARRDLTINSLLFTLWTESGGMTGSVVDFFGGLEDLRRKVMRGVGNPGDRIREDPLRLLRAIRQRNERRGYAIEKATWAAIRRLAPELLRKIPGERVAGELLRSLSANPSGTVEDLRRAGILSILLPEVVAVDRRGGRIRRRYAILERSLGKPLPETLLLANLIADAAQAECDRRVRTASARSRQARAPAFTKKDERSLFRLSLTDAIARRLHFPRVRNVVRLLEDATRLLHIERMKNRNARIEAICGKWGSPDELLSLYRACCRTTGRSAVNFRPILEKAIRRRPILSGDDLLRLGIPSGPRMEEILEEVREATLAGRVGNRKQAKALALSISLTPRAGRAIMPAGFPAGTEREGGRRRIPRRTRRDSRDRPG